ncbi:MAG TPA: hypothetical protein VF691_08775 [Cytophagaceae bacterium]|jgi:hypothetical protein
MEAINGVKILKQDLKKDGEDYLYFKQLAAQKNDNPNTVGQKVSTQTMEKYEYLLVTAKDEIFGVNGDEQNLLDTIPQAYNLAQSMFISS